ncbi:unnamed protein product [Effrenium voratum]|nr:unnamed protein product [Effrenium voratum]
MHHTMRRRTTSEVWYRTLASRALAFPCLDAQEGPLEEHERRTFQPWSHWCRRGWGMRRVVHPCGSMDPGPDEHELSLLQSMMQGPPPVHRAAFGFQRDLQTLLGEMRREPCYAPRPSREVPRGTVVEFLANDLANCVLDRPTLPGIHVYTEHEAYGGMVVWTLTTRKLDKERQLVSNECQIPLAADTNTLFKVILRPQSESGFLKAGGRGFVEVKCVQNWPGDKIRLRLWVANNSCVEQDHDFSHGAVACFYSNTATKQKRVFLFFDQNKASGARKDVTLILQMEPLKPASISL